MPPALAPRRPWSMLLLAALLLAPSGCAKHAAMPDAAPAEAGAYADYDYEVAETLSREESAYDDRPRSAMAAGMPMAPPASMPGNTAPAPKPEPQRPADAVEQAPAARMIHYSGQLRCTVPSVEAALGQAARVAVGFGGFVEQLGPNFVTVRVPGESFEQAFAALADLGDVVERHQGAQDVTDAYQDMALRLKSHQAARDRLLGLLARATTEDEKLQLLREIQRLSDLIENLEIQTRALEDLARYSRITFYADPRLSVSGPALPEPAAFAWIRGWTPFLAGPPGGKRLELGTPDGMVSLNRKGPWVVQGPDGATVWATRLKDDPRGDTPFWFDALEHRLPEGFDSASALDVGTFKVLRLTEGGDRPYVWWVGVSADGRHLDLLHAYFPSPEAEERHKAAVIAAVAGGSGS